MDSEVRLGSRVSLLGNLEYHASLISQTELSVQLLYDRRRREMAHVGRKEVFFWVKHEQSVARGCDTREISTIWLPTLSVASPPSMDTLPLLGLSRG